MQSKKIIWPCSFQQEILVTFVGGFDENMQIFTCKKQNLIFISCEKKYDWGIYPLPFQRLNGRSLRSAIICILIQCYKGYEFLVFISTFSNSVWVNTDLPHSLDKLYHIMSALEGIDVKIIMLICKTVLY